MCTKEKNYNVIMEPVCIQCHTTVRPTDYFCFNCGKNLREAPPSVNAQTQAIYYIGSFFLPPMGVFWGIKYLRQKDDISRRIGMICIGLTVVSLLYATVQTMRIVGQINTQINSQLQQFQGL